MPNRYRSSKISFAQWEQDTVIYNHGSACTHIISNIPAELIDLLFCQHGFSDDELLNSIATAFTENSQEQNNNYLHELTGQLISKELIEKP